MPKSSIKKSGGGISAYCVKCKHKVVLTSYKKRIVKKGKRTTYLVCGVHNGKDKVCRIVSKEQYAKL